MGSISSIKRAETLSIPKYQQYVNYQTTKYRLVLMSEKYFQGRYYIGRTLGKLQCRWDTNTKKKLVSQLLNQGKPIYVHLLYYDKPIYVISRKHCA